MSKQIAKKQKALTKRLFSRHAGRWLTAHSLSAGSGLAGGAGATGVFLGGGETLLQKVGDAILAIPKGVANTIQHYLHAPEYARKASTALDYLKEQGPNVAEELSRGGRYIEAGLNQAQRATADLNQASDYISPGGELPFDPQNAFYSLRDGLNQLETAASSIATGKDQLQDTAGPAIDALKDVDLNPVLQALYNLADNVAPDEIIQTLGIAAGCVATAYIASQYLGGYWGRRGRPNFVSRFIQRKGLKRYKEYFTEHPEEIAGEEAVEIMKANLLQNPGELEKLVGRAGMRISPKIEIDETEGLE